MNRRSTGGGGPSWEGVPRSILFLFFVGFLASTTLSAQNWIGWTETHSEGVTFLSETEPPRTRELAANLVRFRQALRTLAPAAVHQAPVPTQVLIFANEASYRLYKQVLGRRTEHLVGHFTSSTFGDWIAVNGNPGVGDPLKAIFHEATHAFVAHNFPNVPLWLNEGLAEYYSTFVVQGDRVEVGHPIDQHLEVLASEGLVPVRTLFAVDVTSPEYREGDRSGQFYAQSWLLTHYLLSAASEDGGSIERFLALVSHGVGSEDAFRTAFGLSFGQVEEALRGYAKRETYDFWSVPGGLPLQLPYLRLVPANWVRYRLGTYLALTRPQASAAAIRRLQPAAEGGVADAWASLAYLAERAGDGERAEELYEKAASSGAKEALSYVLYGRFLLRRSEIETDEALWAREMLEQAIALDPDFVEPRALYGSSYLLAPPELASEGIRELREAWSRLPGRLDIPFNLAMLFLRAGDEASAERLIDRVIAAGDEELGQRGRDAIAEAREVRRLQQLTAEYNRVVATINQGEYDRAIRELLALQAEELPASLRQAVDETLAQLRVKR